MVLPHVSIVILNFNGKQYLKDCLNSVLKQSHKNISMVFVDNASADNSVEYVRKNYIKYIKTGKLLVIANDKNYGYTEGNNIGIRVALKNKKTKYVAILNNDTAVDKDWVKEMLLAAEKDKKAGSCACKTIVYHNRNAIDTAGVIIYNNCSGAGRGGGLPATMYSEKEYIFGAYGAAAFYRRAMLEDVSIIGDYFDHDYFIYQEEFDLSWRALLMGWKCIYVPTAVVYHIGSVTARKRVNAVKYLLERNRVWTTVKNLQSELITYCLPHIIVYEILTIPFYIRHKQLLVVLKARLDAIVHIKKMLKKRSIIQNNVKITPLEMKKYFMKRKYIR